MIPQVRVEIDTNDIGSIGYTSVWTTIKNAVDGLPFEVDLRVKAIEWRHEHSAACGVDHPCPDDLIPPPQTRYQPVTLLADLVRHRQITMEEALRILEGRVNDLRGK